MLSGKAVEQQLAASGRPVQGWNPKSCERPGSRRGSRKRFWGNDPVVDALLEKQVEGGPAPESAALNP